MQLSPEQQKILEEQKAQCIFCQIIEGKIPTKKIYEDKLIIGILDINPASKGHVLLMPKEHYPIMPLIPPETFKHLADKLKAVDACVKEAMLCKETTIFVANGGAAGQQSAHFMIHIIPRENRDGLEMLDVEGKEGLESETKEVVENTGPILSAMLHRNLPELGFTGQSASDAPGNARFPETNTQITQQRIGKEQILQIIRSNPHIKKLILEKPEQFKHLVPKHPQLNQLFTGINIDEIIEEIRKETLQKKPGKLSLDDALKEDNK